MKVLVLSTGESERLCTWKLGLILNHESRR
jgi:hypothetical protein